MTAEEIRKLRGDLSREAFGRIIGVSGNTVYRWEAKGIEPDEKNLRDLEKYVKRMAKSVVHRE